MWVWLLQSKLLLFIVWKGSWFWLLHILFSILQLQKLLFSFFTSSAFLEWQAKVQGGWLYCHLVVIELSPKLFEDHLCWKILSPGFYCSTLGLEGGGERSGAVNIWCQTPLLLNCPSSTLPPSIFHFPRMIFVHFLICSSGILQLSKKSVGCVHHVYTMSFQWMSWTQNGSICENWDFLIEYEF